METLKRGKTLFETRVEKSASRDRKNRTTIFSDCVTALYHTFHNHKIIKRGSWVEYNTLLALKYSTESWSPLTFIVWTTGA